MAEKLWPLLRLKADSDDELKELYRQVYIENYVQDKDGNEIEIYDWQGNRVTFPKRQFDHAFSEATNYRTSAGVHDKPFSKRRARHILWIKEVLAASNGTIERRAQMRKDSRGKIKKRRNLIVVEERYVVVLNEEKGNPGKLVFITAFPADESYLRKIRGESALLEIRKPQS